MLSIILKFLEYMSALSYLLSLRCSVTLSSSMAFSAGGLSFIISCKTASSRLPLSSVFVHESAGYINFLSTLLLLKISSMITQRKISTELTVEKASS